MTDYTISSTAQHSHNIPQKAAANEQLPHADITVTGLNHHLFFRKSAAISHRP